MSAIGMNLSGVAYWSTEDPFIDRIKTSGWYLVTDAGWQDLAPDASLDANGYPTSMAPGVHAYEAEFEVDPPTAGTSNVYVLTPPGQGTIDVPFDQVITLANMCKLS